jgi:hypothetical protein
MEQPRNLKVKGGGHAIFRSYFSLFRVAGLRISSTSGRRENGEEA